MSRGVYQTFSAIGLPVTLRLVDENNFGVPAGWYPDPLGLPQLRWWDSQAWTEHTSEARAPIIVQPTATSTRVGWADDDLPSRREQRERERRESTAFVDPRPFADDLAFADDLDFGGASEGLASEDLPERDELSAQPLLAMTLRELEPPLSETAEEPAPSPRRASTHANAAPEASTLSALAEEIAPARAPKAMRTYTAAVWFIAFMPAIQLAVSVGLILGGLGHNLPLFLVVWFAPYLVVLGLAAFDRLLLQVWGHKNPASSWWALLREPGYLIARAVRTYKETGRGLAPLAAFAASSLTVLAGILVLPGLVIAAFPATFASEVAVSVEADAAALGAELDVTCPAPPLIVGEVFACTATKVETGETDSIAVELVRQSGWINWRVVDWGGTVWF